MISLLEVLCEMTSGLKQFLFLQDHPRLLGAAVGTCRQPGAIATLNSHLLQIYTLTESLYGIISVH